MLSAIEVTASWIRLVAVRDGRITALEQWPVPIGADPLAVLASAPLPPGLGRVRVVLHHEDLLVRAQVMPNGPQERLDRLVRFDALSSMAEGSDPMTVAWCQAPVGDGDARVLVQLCKRRLIERVRQALDPAGARPAALLHPALGLVEVLRVAEPDHHGVAVLLDVGGRNLHLALVKDGQPVLLRSGAPAADELVARLADKRGLPREDAAALLARIADGSPDDLKDLITAHAGAIAAQVTAAVRFARTQYHLDTFEPSVLHLAGAGAQAHGLAHALSQRLSLPVRLLNPFAGQLATVDMAQLDRLALLPSPWAAVVGAAAAQAPALDSMADERRERQERFRTGGVLHWAAAAVLLLMAGAIALAEMRHAAAARTLADLRERAPRADATAKAVAAARQARDAARTRLAWLDGERRAGRVAPELLAAVASLQDPASCPVVLTALRVEHQGDTTRVELEGAATAAGRSGTDAVLRQFERGLREAYPAIAEVKAVPVPLERDRHPFRFLVAIPDRGR